MFQIELVSSDTCYQALTQKAGDWRRIIGVYRELGERWNQLAADNLLIPQSFAVAYSPESCEISGSALTRKFSITLSPAKQSEHFRGLCTITTPNTLSSGHALVGRFFLDDSGFIYDEAGEQAIQQNIYSNSWLILANVFNVVATFNEPPTTLPIA